ncbi:MAG TPA: hypothetical protein VK559_06350 [Ferruginibacter sp.]|nr:hypothetical protein [Ferruginibacter sp.]
MKKELELAINGKMYHSSYIRVGNKFIVDTHHKDFSGILMDNFTFHIIRGKPMYFITHSETEEVGKQIISQIDQNEHMLN